MSLLDKIKAQIQSLIGLANEKTGNADTDLTAAVNALARGYGSGGSDEEFVGVKLSEFVGSYYQPRVADARSLKYLLDNAPGDASAVVALCLFQNNSKNGNGGLYVRLEEVYMPDGLSNLGSTFVNCSNLTTIHGDMSNVKSLGVTFSNCTRLTEIPYMPNITYFGANSFQNCTGLTEAKIYSKPSTMLTTTFNGCTNIKDIYVPWSEGEVANAPWGATNATIHYNTIYDENHNPIV